jgi:hypothetical protein
MYKYDTDLSHFVSTLSSLALLSIPSAFPISVPILKTESDFESGIKAHFRTAIAQNAADGRVASYHTGDEVYLQDEGSEVPSLSGGRLTSGLLKHCESGDSGSEKEIRTSSFTGPNIFIAVAPAV